ncbi:MAG TPA: hypothetical protein VEC37_18695 [Bacillota bacterium]|nr:hypothetical protein [Bacillota bacterium]
MDRMSLIKKYKFKPLSHEDIAELGRALLNEYKLDPGKVSLEAAFKDDRGIILRRGVSNLTEFVEPLQPGFKLNSVIFSTDYFFIDFNQIQSTYGSYCGVISKINADVVIIVHEFIKSVLGLEELDERRTGMETSGKVKSLRDPFLIEPVETDPQMG